MPNLTPIITSFVIWLLVVRCTRLSHLRYYKLGIQSSGFRFHVQLLLPTATQAEAVSRFRVTQSVRTFTISHASSLFNFHRGLFSHNFDISRGNFQKTTLLSRRTGPKLLLIQGQILSGSVSGPLTNDASAFRLVVPLDMDGGKCHWLVVLLRQLCSFQRFLLLPQEPSRLISLVPDCSTPTTRV